MKLQKGQIIRLDVLGHRGINYVIAGFRRMERVAAGTVATFEIDDYILEPKGLWLHLMGPHVLLLRKDDAVVPADFAVNGTKAGTMHTFEVTEGNGYIRNYVRCTHRSAPYEARIVRSFGADDLNGIPQGAPHVRYWDFEMVEPDEAGHDVWHVLSSKRTLRMAGSRCCADTPSFRPRYRWYGDVDVHVPLLKEPIVKLLLALTSLYLLIASAAVTVGCRLMSLPSDLAFYAGIGLLLVVGVTTLALLRPFVRMLRRAVTDVARFGGEVRRGPWLPMLLLVVAGANAGCMGCTTIDPGHVGIKVNQWGENRGVQDTTLVTGQVVYNPISETVFQYPTFVQTAVWTANKDEGHPVNEEITFTNKDQLQVAADISVAYSLKRDRVPYFYVKFRSDDIDTFTHGYLRNLAREKFDNAAGKYSIEQIMGDNAVFLAEVRGALQKELDPIGVVLEQFGFIGAPRPPMGIIYAINAKMAATQRAIQAENELRQAEAEARKRVAMADGDAKARVAQAEGEAKANVALAKSLSPELLEWLRVDALRMAVNKWDGHRPAVESGGGGILLQLPAPTAAAAR